MTKSKLDLAVLNGQYEELRSDFASLENTTCDLKLKLAATRSALDDAEYTKKTMQKQLVSHSAPNSGVKQGTPSIVSLSSFMGFK